MSKIASLFAAALILLAANVGRGQNFWVQTNGPYSCGAECFTMIGTNLFLGTGRGVYRSTDSGATWKLRKLFKPVQSLASIGTKLFAGSVQKVLYQSTDSGATWTPVGSNLGGWTYYDVNVIIAFGGNLIVSTDHGVFRTTDTGTTWLQDSEMSRLRFNCFAVSGGTLLGGTYDSGVYISSDSGMTWHRTGNGIPSYSYVSALALSGTNIYAAADSQVFRSSDNGATWIASDSTLPVIRALAVEGTNLFAGTNQGVFRSADSGLTWASMGARITCSTIGSFAVLGKNLLAGTWPCGVFKSTNEGASWKMSNAGITEFQNVLNLASIGNNIFAGTYDGGLFRSGDDGATWRNVGPFSKFGWMVGTLDGSGSNLFAEANGMFFLSTDSGTSWTERDSGAIRGAIVKAQAVRDSELFAAGAYGEYNGGGPAQMYRDRLFRSTNNGISWTNVDAPDSVNSAVGFLGTELFVGTVEGFSVPVCNIYRSTNDGASWLSSATFYFQGNYPIWQYITCFGSVGTTLLAGTDGYGVYRTTDSGVTWNQANRGLTNNNISCFATFGSSIFAATRGNVFCSTDSGLSWLPASTDTLGANALCINDNNLFAGGAGVSRLPLLQSKINELPTIRTDIFCSPNPFPQSTTISFTLPAPSYITLTLFDATGREVKQVANGFFGAGAHEVPFARGTLPAGVYFYRMEANGASQTRAMVVE